ncbi:MFS transporter [Lentzea sp. BCCO 10_0061]|uniref:MFS transporter n=1 Tax=Lentzea sokolovensis TaxID=3095429 RepID=A0ABU4V5M9_9PSEU|nr:MFS transporter [Lentzea sp. BCCO 10_0061]MDX8147102.1 MFS transporter [Lentzea sp. BCCO 10_0061]
MTVLADRHLVLVNQGFRQIFLADVLSQAGSQVVLIGLPLVALVAVDASAFEAAVLAACGTLPLPVVGLFAGAWVDRVRRRTVMISADVGRAVLLSTVPFAWWFADVTMIHLYLVALGAGVLTVFFDVAYQSSLPQLVPRERLVEGNAALQTVYSVAQTTGPGLTGLLVQWFTAPFALVAAVVGYLWSAACVSLISVREIVAERSARRNLGREIGEGVRFLLGHRLLRFMMACSASLNFFGGLGAPMLMVLLVQDLRVSVGTIGVLFTFTGLGGVVGGLLVSRVMRAFGQGPGICLAAAMFGVPPLLIPLAGQGWRLWLVAAALFAGSVGRVVYNVSVVSFRQAATPPALLGRVSATGRVLLAGTVPLSNLLGGVLASVAGPRPVLWVAGAGAALSFAWVYFSPLRSMRELPMPDVATSAEPENVPTLSTAEVKR